MSVQGPDRHCGWVGPQGLPVSVSRALVLSNGPMPLPHVIVEVVGISPHFWASFGSIMVVVVHITLVLSCLDGPIVLVL